MCGTSLITKGTHAMAGILRIYELVNKKTLINLSVNQNVPEFDRLHGFHKHILIESNDSFSNTLKIKHLPHSLEFMNYEYKILMRIHLPVLV